MARISICEAKKLAKKAGWNFSKDFYEQGTISQKEDLKAIAKLKGYRKSKTSGGSTARAFFEYLAKSKNC